MNKWMMTLACAVQIGGTAMAQANVKANEGSKADQLTERMTTRLKLDADQAAKVKEINDRYAKEINMMRKENKATKEAGQTVDREENREEFKALTAKKNNELSQVLTKEQMVEWEKMQAEMREKLQERHQERKANRVEKAKTE